MPRQGYFARDPRTSEVVCRPRHPMSEVSCHKTQIPLGPATGSALSGRPLTSPGSKSSRPTSRPGLHLTLYTSPPSPLITLLQTPSPASHSRTVPSPDALATNLPERDAAQSQTREVCPRSAVCSSPVEVEKTRSVASLDPLTACSPSGWRKATHLILAVCPTTRRDSRVGRAEMW
jgi:hypothetical protein